MAEVFQACAMTGFYEQLFQFHSRTAQYGELTRKETVLPDTVRASMAEALEYIRSGKFAEEWAREEERGFPRFNALLEEARRHPICEAERRMAALVDFGSSFTIARQANSRLNGGRT